MFPRMPNCLVLRRQNKMPNYAMHTDSAKTLKLQSQITGAVPLLRNVKPVQPEPTSLTKRPR
jgi:hypothetical protein